MTKRVAISPCAAVNKNKKAGRVDYRNVKSKIDTGIRKIGMSRSKSRKNLNDKSWFEINSKIFNLDIYENSYVKGILIG